MIDIELWNRIKKQYPDKVEERQKGISNSIDELLFHQEVTHQIASEGEIGKAFQLEIQNFEQENRVIRYFYAIQILLRVEIFQYRLVSNISFDFILVKKKGGNPKL